MSEETQYYLERKGLSDMEGAESSYWSDISTPSDVTVVYGMTEENQESYINNSGWTAYMSSVYAMLGNSRMTVFVMSFAILAGAAAVLLPLKKKWDMGDAPIFGVPFEIVIFVLCMIPVSYTHLDVYKRQAEFCTQSASISPLFRRPIPLRYLH